MTPEYLAEITDFLKDSSGLNAYHARALLDYCRELEARNKLLATIPAAGRVADVMKIQILEAALDWLMQVYTPQIAPPHLAAILAASRLRIAK